MTLRVLKTAMENRVAREGMVRRGISFLPQQPRRGLLERLRLRQPISVGDPLKSWDVLSTIDLLTQRLDNSAAILDLGAYGSELPPALHVQGFQRLHGIDFNPRVREMPFNDVIDYRVGDMMATPFASGSMAAVTAISSIEHGVNPDDLLREVQRLLAPGGIFAASTDYWPEKIDTAGIRMFGLEWNIFSRDELAAFVAKARAYGLTPMGDCDFAAGDPMIEVEGRRYTFAWLALEKSVA